MGGGEALHRAAQGFFCVPLGTRPAMYLCVARIFVIKARISVENRAFVLIPPLVVP